MKAINFKSGTNSWSITMKLCLTMFFLFSASLIQAQNGDLDGDTGGSDNDIYRINKNNSNQSAAIRLHTRPNGSNYQQWSLFSTKTGTSFHISRNTTNSDKAIGTYLMSLTQHGQLGIGVKNPNARLSIKASDTYSTPNQNGIYLYQFDENLPAIITARVDADGTGDPFISLDVNGENGWSMGVDNSDGNKFKIAPNWSNVGNSPSLTINREGKVGIGLTDPSYMVDVAGAIRAGTGLAVVGNTTVSATGTFGDKLTVSSGGLDVTGNINLNSVASIADNTFDITTNTSIKASNWLTLKVADNTDSQGLQFQNSAGSYTWSVYRENVGDNLASLNFAGGLDPETNNLTTAMTLTHNEGVKIYTRLAIGDININDNAYNDFALAVAGNVQAQEIKVTNDGSAWPDYVFEKNYHLKKLEEVEAFITENKHLPNVPSAKEVSKNGVKLGEMDAVLLRKIEELTLYLIEIKKDNEAMKKELELLKKQK